MDFEIVPKIMNGAAALAWPIVAIIVFFKLKPVLSKLLVANDVSIDVAGFKLNVANATESIGGQVTDIQKKIVELEQKIDKIKSDADGISLSEVDHQVIQILKTDAVKSILWVDDFPSNNAFLISRFRSSGIKVDTAMSTNEGVLMHKNGSYNVIISDLGRIEDGVNNPLAGIDLIKRIRHSDGNTPIIIFAGGRGVKMKSSILEAGANEVTDSGIDVISFVGRYIPQALG